MAHGNGKTLGLEARDWIWIATLLIGLAAQFGALSWRLGAVEARVAELDRRIYDMLRDRVALVAPADATRVALPGGAP